MAHPAETSRQEQFKNNFEKQRGPGTWEQFCDLVYHKVAPKQIQKVFPSKSGNPMDRPSYYKWEARAWEVKSEND